VTPALSNHRQSARAFSQLQVRGLRKRYGAITALDGIDLEIPSGELFGLLGPNGAGKTTLLSILSGLIQADAGQARLDDKHIHPDEPRVRRRIGLAPQDLALYHDLTARENLVFFARLYGLSGTSLDQQVDRALQAVQLADRADHRTATFSGGMKRRLNLALSVVHQPDILFLDEPTTGVDPQSRNHIFEEVRRLNAEGMTIVYTSHYMEEVQALCTRVGIIDHGKVIRCAPLEELLRLDEVHIRVRLPRDGHELQNSFATLPGVKDVSVDESGIELKTTDANDTLSSLIRVFHEKHLVMEGLEIAPPTLERVFLRLTGRALRD